MWLSILILTALIVYLAWDRYRHPKRECPQCQGSGRKRSLWNGKAYGVCRRCLGRGEVRR